MNRQYTEVLPHASLQMSARGISANGTDYEYTHKYITNDQNSWEDFKSFEFVVTNFFLCATSTDTLACRCS
jgi:hypothetical protein